MNSIDLREKQMIQKWASVHSDDAVFDERFKADKDSYFMSRSGQDTYIMKYEFESIPQLQEKIAVVCGDKIDRQMQKMMAIAAFKCREQFADNMQETDTDGGVDRGNLPEFTYAF